MLQRTPPADTGTHRNVLWLAAAHGIYVLLGGLWPLVSMTTFEYVTGPKPDEWLVRSVAGILVFLGGVLLHGVWTKRIDRSLRVMAGGISFVLGLVAVVTSLAGWISWKYTIDGIVHLSFTAAWIVLGMRHHNDNSANMPFA